MELGLLLIACFVLGIIAGIFIPYIKPHGELRIDTSNPEKDRYLMVYYLPFDSLEKKHHLRFRVTKTKEVHDDRTKENQKIQM